MYFYLPVISFLVGVIGRSLVSLPNAAAATLLVLGASCVGLHRLRSTRALLFSGIAIVACALGMLRVAIASQALPGAFVPLLNKHADFTGVVVADPDVRETGKRITVRVLKGGAVTRVIAVLPHSADADYGDTVRITGTLAAPAPFAGDGGRVFRYDQYLEKDGVFAIISPAHATVTAHATGLIQRAVGVLYGITDSFARGLETSLPEPEAGLAQGLVTGGKQELGKALLAAFTAAGIVQIVVLSGYNVMIVAEATMKATSRLPKLVSFIAASIGIIAFVIAAGSGSSAVRAAVMACLALFARASGRTYRVLRALCFTIALMALWNPFVLAFDPSFQLSALATFGLILGVPLVEPRLGWVGNALLREALATTIAAECAVLPLLLWQTGNFSIVSVPANVLVSFIVPAAMAASAIAGFAGMLLPSFAPIIGLPAYAMLWIIVRAAEFAAALPFAQVILPAFPFWLALAAYAVMGWFAIRGYYERSAPAPAGALPNISMLSAPSLTAVPSRSDPRTPSS